MMHESNEKIEKLNGYVEQSIRELIREFKSYPTLYLEEQHLHNKFDSIIRKAIPAESQMTHLRISSNSDQTVPFPMIMNEYTTVNHYKRKIDKNNVEGEMSFQKCYNEKGEGSPGSLDYVFLDDEWVKIINITKSNPYNVAVNKDAESRIEARNESLQIRFLATIEFKYFHYGKLIKSWDEEEKNIEKYSVTALTGRVQKEILEDSYKQINEKSPNAHVVYFNSYIPLDKESLNKIRLYLEKELKKVDLSQTKLKVWYSQGGLPNRFNYSEEINEPLLFEN